jgi:glutathione S-transferase
MFRHGDLTTPYYALRRGDESAREQLDAQLSRVDDALSLRPWLGGGDYGLADIAYVPWILRMQQTLGIQFDAQPALADWLDRMVERPAVAAEAGIVAAL